VISHLICVLVYCEALRLLLSLQVDMDQGY